MKWDSRAALRRHIRPVNSNSNSNRRIALLRVRSCYMPDVASSLSSLGAGLSHCLCEFDRFSCHRSVPPLSLSFCVCLSAVLSFFHTSQAMPLASCALATLLPVTAAPFP